MAEVAASIIAFIQLTDTVIRVCSHFISNAKDAPRDMVIIASEVTSLRTILSCFHQDELHPSTAEALPNLFASSGPIQACYKSISALERLLPKVPDDAARKTSFNLADLSWALKESQVRKLLAEITLHKSTLLLALTGDLMHEIKDVKAGVERVEQALTRSERTEVLEWLQSRCHNPSAIHNRMLELHEEHTGEWLSKWNKWNSWLLSEQTPQDRFLWIHGIPGAGKSVLASVGIESIKSHYEKFTTTERPLGYAYYYCHYSHSEDSGLPLLSWIISRLGHQSDWVPPQLKTIRDSGCEPTIAQMMSILQSISERFSAVYLVIDGVDESQPRTRLLSVLTTVATDKHFQTVRLLATSRMHQDIERCFSGIAASISMSNAFVSQDIQTVVQRWIAGSPRMKCWSHLSERIEEKLCSGAHGMFRWVACQMDILERIREESQLVRALNSLPRDLDEVYVRLLDGIPEIDRPFVRRVLLWIAGHSNCGRLRDEGIHIDALVGAVCDDLRHATGGTYRYTAEDVRELCGCLITVQEHELPFTDFLTEVYMTQNAEGDSIVYKSEQDVDKPPKGHFVRIAHYTVMEFLASDRILASTARWCFMAWSDVAGEFFRSVFRQSLTADPDGASVDWVRDREPYCLTLVPLLTRGINIMDPEILDLCVRYFLPTSPHYPRLCQIQAHLVTGCSDAQSFYMSRLPVYDPRLLASEYHHNPPHAWAIVGMIVAFNKALAREYMRTFSSPQYDELVGSELLLTFLKPWRDGESARYRTYRTTLGQELHLRQVWNELYPYKLPNYD